MDQAGAWVRETFGCQLTRSGTRYSQTCPVALAHNRIGMSIGGTARRLCSLCGDDLSECEHIPGISYLVRAAYPPSDGAASASRKPASTHPTKTTGYPS
jgi:hypothetical protein